VSADFSIREADERDAAAIVDLWTAGYVTEGEGGRTAPYAENDFFEAAQRARVFVIERGGTVVGVVALSAPGTPGQAVARDDEAELSKLVVASSARHRGIGRVLTIHCEVLARAEAWGAIALWSRHYQRPAHRLYESLGYRRAPERDTVDETGFARLVFRRQL
jgi:ribosomal protein S18 acetylase RimI-like enzyme